MDKTQLALHQGFPFLFPCCLTLLIFKLPRKYLAFMSIPDELPTLDGGLLGVVTFWVKPLQYSSTYERSGTSAGSQITPQSFVVPHTIHVVLLNTVLLEFSCPFPALPLAEIPVMSPEDDRPYYLFCFFLNQLESAYSWLCAASHSWRCLGDLLHCQGLKLGWPHTRLATCPTHCINY